MKIRAVNHRAVSVDKGLLTDGKLSPGAKGIFAFLLSVRPGYDMTYKEIMTYNKIGRQGLQSLLDELSDNGYLETTDDGVKLFNGIKKGFKPVARAQDKSDKPKRTPDEWREIRTQERMEFIDQAKKIAKEMKPPQPSTKVLHDFVNWWAGIDSLDPSKPLRFKSARPFSMAGRIRTFMKNDKEKVNTDRL